MLRHQCENTEISFTLDELQLTISAATQCEISREWSIILSIAGSSEISDTNKLFPLSAAASSMLFNLKISKTSL